jgi:phosphatidylinositol glycan class S
VFNFSIESQILYHAPLSFEPTYGPAFDTDDGQVARAIEAAQGGDQRAEEVAAALLDDRKGDEAWLIDEEMMKVFVNSERWSLGE